MESTPPDEAATAQPSQEVAEPQPEPSEQTEPSEEVASQPEETIYQQVDYEMPLFDQTAEISMWYPLRQDNVQAPEKASGDQQFWATIQDKLNVDIAFTEPGQSVATEKFNLMCASGEMPDLMVETLCTSGDGGAYTGGYDKAIEDEVYMDISQVIEDYCPNYCYWINLTETNKKVAYTDGGMMGAFLTINGEASLSSQGLACNADMFAKTGLDKPETPNDWKEMYKVLMDNGVSSPCDINSSMSILDGG